METTSLSGRTSKTLFSRSVPRLLMARYENRASEQQRTVIAGRKTSESEAIFPPRTIALAPAHPICMAFQTFNGIGESVLHLILQAGSAGWDAARSRRTSLRDFTDCLALYPRASQAALDGALASR